MTVDVSNAPSLKDELPIALRCRVCLLITYWAAIAIKLGSGDWVQYTKRIQSRYWMLSRSGCRFRCRDNCWNWSRTKCWNWCGSTCRIYWRFRILRITVIISLKSMKRSFSTDTSHQYGGPHCGHYEEDFNHGERLRCLCRPRYGRSLCRLTMLLWKVDFVVSIERAISILHDCYWFPTLGNTVSQTVEFQIRS